MIRTILMLIVAVLLITDARAAGAADLQAATTAVEKGNSDEAIRLFTQALASGELSADDQLKAREGRGREYSAKSLITDAFDRRDDGRRLRENAIADFSAALGLRPDSVNTRLDRGQAYHLNRQFDLAVADFSAALDRDKSPAVLLQRAASQRAKGAYDEAIADGTAALAGGASDPPLDVWDIHVERGYSEFLAGRFDAAAADFDKAISLGAESRKDDVLWLPYQMAWLHISHARAGRTDAQELTSIAARINLTQWPGTLIAFFLGQTKFEDISAASNHGAMGRSRDCNLSLLAGEDTLAKAGVERARELIQHAHDVCNVHTLQYLVAEVELGRLKQ